MDILSSSYTDKGSRPGINQDAVVELKGTTVSVFCVADGMGGHEHGELASKAIADNVASWHASVNTGQSEKDFTGIMDSFEKMMSDVNGYIYSNYNREGICGSTVAALIMSEDMYAVFSAGDSRVYRKRGFTFSRITSDDVWQNDRTAIKGMKKDQILSHPCYGKLTKSVGTDAAITLSRTTGRLKKGDIFFICCDGVYKNIDDKHLRKMINRPDAIIDAVNNTGAKDNFSFVSIKIN